MWDPTVGLVPQLSSITNTAGVVSNLTYGVLGWAPMHSGVVLNPVAVATDVHGSVIPSTGNTLARNAACSAFGSPLEANTFEPRLGYRGELMLDNQLWLRARTYQPSIGRLTTRDPAPGRPGTTTFVDPRHYADNNPVNRFDPTGMFSQKVTSGSRPGESSAVGAGGSEGGCGWNPVCHGAGVVDGVWDETGAIGEGVVQVATTNPIDTVIGLGSAVTDCLDEPLALAVAPVMPGIFLQADAASALNQGRRQNGWGHAFGTLLPNLIPFTVAKLRSATAASRDSKGVGTCWFDPAAPQANGIRIDVGIPGSSWPSQQVDHVVVRSGGRILGPDGKPIVGALRDNLQAHIPLSDWLDWNSWNVP